MSSGTSFQPFLTLREVESDRSEKKEKKTYDIEWEAKFSKLVWAI